MQRWMIFGIQLAATTINGVQDVRVLFNMRVLCAREADGSTTVSGIDNGRRTAAAVLLGHCEALFR